MNHLNCVLGFFLLLVLGNTPEQKSSDAREFVITYEKYFVVSNNHVGNDWVTYLKIGEEVVKEGEEVKLQLTNRSPVRIIAQAIEEDKNYDDTGSTTLELTYSEMIAMQKNRFEIEVPVVENGGYYQGHVAVLKFLVRVEQVE